MPEDALELLNSQKLAEKTFINPKTPKPLLYKEA
jgi:hypothetical protein